MNNAGSTWHTKMSLLVQTVSLKQTDGGAVRNIILCIVSGEYVVCRSAIVSLCIYIRVCILHAYI